MLLFFSLIWIHFCCTATIQRNGVSLFWKDFAPVRVRPLSLDMANLRFWTQKSMVHIRALTIFIKHLFTVKCSYDENKEKGGARDELKNYLKSQLMESSFWLANSCWSQCGTQVGFGLEWQTAPSTIFISNDLRTKNSVCSLKQLTIFLFTKWSSLTCQ